MRFAVIGAGPAGLAAAHELARSGATGVVLERAPHLGGLARTLELWGRPVELGPHTVASDGSDAAALLDSVIGPDSVTPTIRRGLWRAGRMLDYPPGIANVLSVLGPTGTARAALEIVPGRLRRRAS